MGIQKNRLIETILLSTQNICRVSSVLYIPIFSYIWKTVLYIPIFSYIWKTVLYIPIYSYIWKTVLYIPIFRGKQEMLNSYLKQMLLISNIERRKFVIQHHLLSNSHYYASYRQRLDRDMEEKERHLKQQELAKAEKKRLEREREDKDKRTTSLLDMEKEL